MNFNVGDKVTIISREWFDKVKDCDNNYIDFVEPMTIYCGMTATITKIRCNVFTLDIDHGYWDWKDYMFSDSSLTSSLNETINSIREYCSNVCVMDCEKICPLYKYIAS